MGKSSGHCYHSEARRIIIKCSSQHHSILIADSTEVKSQHAKGTKQNYFFAINIFLVARLVKQPTSDKRHKKQGVQWHPSSLSHGWRSAVLSPMEQSSDYSDIGVRHTTGEWNSRRLHVGGRGQVQESTQGCPVGMQPILRCKLYKIHD